VIVESPYSGDVPRNMEYLRKCLRDCIMRGESPYASHGLISGALDEATERQRGIEAGYAWWRVADKVVFYTDLGWSRGMAAAMDRLQRQPTFMQDGYPKLPFEIRKLPCTNK
jgi:hypothetical protein